MEDKPTVSKRKDRASNWRVRTNERTMKEHEAKINSRLNVGLSDMYQDLQAMCTGGTIASVPYPITTRGIGLHIQTIIETLKDKYPKFFDAAGVTQDCVYRIALAQLSYKLSLCNKAEANTSYQSPETTSSMTIDMQVAVCAVKENLNLVSSAINQTGIVKEQDVEMVPFVPALESLPDSMDVEVVAEPSATSSKRKHVERSTPLPRPDPFLVTITNLRDTVVALSDPLTPPEVRSYFRKLSPLPNARWSDSNLLLNPDQIMPHGYDLEYLRRDIAKFKSFLTLIKGKDTNLVGTLSYEGKGLDSALMSTSFLDGRISQFNTEAIHRAPNIDVYSRAKHLNHLDNLYGPLLLMGELPPLKGENGKTEWSYSGDAWTYRSRSLAGYHWNDVDRTAMVQKVIQ